jgi:hypothetical protein
MTRRAYQPLLQAMTALLAFLSPDAYEAATIHIRKGV